MVMIEVVLLMGGVIVGVLWLVLGFPMLERVVVLLQLLIALLVHLRITWKGGDDV